MKFESKFALGEVVYVTYEEKSGILVELDTINEIVFKKEGILYFTEHCYDQISESQIFKLDEFNKIKYLLIEVGDDDV